MTVKTGASIIPCAARYLQGWGTQFSIPQTHKNERGEIVYDGFISVIASGEYPFEKGDRIKILKIKSATLKKANNGVTYYTVFADIELVKETYRVRKGQRDISKIKDNIPEELL